MSGTCIDRSIQLRISEGTRFLESILAACKFSFGELKSSAVPQNPGVYVVYEEDVAVYVGTTGSLRRRIVNNLWAGRNHYLATHLMRDKLPGGRRRLAALHGPQGRTDT